MIAAGTAGLIILAAGAGLGTIGIFDSSRDQAGMLPGADNSIGVLPFANVGGHADDDYLGDGIAEEKLNVYPYKI